MSSGSQIARSHYFLVEDARAVRQARAFGDDGRTVDVEAVHKDPFDDDSANR
ncbi:hypothetical protein AB4Y32_07870 [Paraburkholderia phymatum]|uniref:Uncharacterized protein n=1 Tax=Paraburkholderia phymatum TaxID=148447 RepID=A0ACC6TWR6_9BURK